ncbi:MAG: hypothetical protein K2Y05_05740, partial [Hyphomicrobiaceae bacterium]|nr:hypothetical protein [Hyphomicrobiaceae bacterium]
GRTDPIMHARTRPPLCETMADLAIFEMALETGAHVHIAHSSLARGFDLAEIFRKQGAMTSGEACIQYLCMTEEDLVRLQGFGKCNPPFRTADEVERIWGSITDIYARLGDRYFVLSDDIRLSPATVAERVAAYASAHPAPGGAIPEDVEPQRPTDPDRAAVKPLAVPKPGSGS